MLAALLLLQSVYPASLRGDGEDIAAALDGIQSQPLQGTADQYQPIGNAKNLVKGMSRVPGPPPRIASRTYLDPNLHQSAFCERDLTSCPDTFVKVGDGQCAAGDDYSGPSTDEAYDFSNWSSMALDRFSEQFGVAFKCKQCSRDLSAPCPIGWSGEGTECSPPVDYSSSCETTDFGGYSESMKEYWSSICNAWFPCA